jgi:hypothetical protein
MAEVTMIHIALDTTAFREDPSRKSADWRVVERLAKKGKLQLYLSEICRREFITHQQGEYLSALNSTKKSIRKIKSILNDKAAVGDPDPIFNALDSRHDEIGNRFDAWISEHNGTVLQIGDKHGLDVVRRYFDGADPFSQVKSRQDFPDAFAFVAILDLLTSLVPDRLNVVTGDGNLANSLRRQERTSVHKSLADFVESHGLGKLLQRTENLDAFLGFATSSSDSQAIVNAIEELLPGHTVDGLPEEYEATVDSFGEIRDLDVDADRLVDFGEGIFSVPFSATSECLIGYFMPKSDWYGLPPENTPTSIEDWNDHVFRVDEYFDLRIEGTLSFETEPGALDGRIRKMKEWAQVFSVMDVDVEIDELVIADEEAAIARS